MNHQIDMFEVLNEKNPLFDDIKKIEWVEYAKKHQYGKVVDDWILDYVASDMTSSIEHFDYVKQGYKSKKQIIELINVKINKMCNTKTYHSPMNDKYVIFSIKRDDTYYLFIKIGDKVLIRESLEDAFKDFRFPNMCYKVYDLKTKEYIFNPNDRLKLLKEYFCIENFACGYDEMYHQMKGLDKLLFVKINIINIINYYKED